MRFFLVGYMFLFICRPFETHPFLAAIHLERLWMIVSICYYFLCHPRNSRSIPLLTPVFGFYVVILVSGLVSSDYEGWSLIAERYFKQIIFFLLLASSVDTEEEFVFIIKAYIYILIFYEIKSLYDYAFHGRYHYRQGIKRLIGMGDSYSDPNAVASTINYAIPYAVALLSIAALSARERWAVFLFIAISVSCIVLTGSRAGFVTLCLNGLLVWLRSKRSFGSVVIVGVIGCLVWVAMPEDKKIRVVSMINPAVIENDSIAQQAEDSMKSRTLGLTDGFAMLMSRPVLGYGAGNFKTSRPTLGPDGLRYESHNMYGQLMGELGFIGIGVFLAIVAGMIRHNRMVIQSGRKLSEFAYANINSMLMLLFNGYGSHNLYRYNWLWLFGFTSLLVILTKKSQTELS